MQPVVRPLFLLHRDLDLRAALARIPGQPYALTMVGDWEALGEALRRAPLTAIPVVDPHLGSSGDGQPSETLLALLRTFPSVAVVAALPVQPETGDAVRTLAEWGVAEIVDLVRERTPEALARRLRLVEGRTMERLLRRALPESIPARSRALLTVAAEVVAWGGQAPELADSLGVSERTVARWCARADLPPARRLLAWMRVLLAAELLDDPGRSIAGVARACGYSGAASLKGALRGLLQMTPQELRTRGAFDLAARTFSRELMERREQARARGKPARAWLN